MAPAKINPMYLYAYIAAYYILHTLKIFLEYSNDKVHSLTVVYDSFTLF